MQKKLFVACNIMFVTVTIAFDLCYMELGGLLLKTAASLGFTVLGALNLIYAVHAGVPKKFPAIMLLGLFLCMLGDVVINLSFIPGALIFALGHVAYFFAYCMLMPMRPIDLIPIVLLFTGSVLVLTVPKIYDFGGNLLLGVCIFYGLVISFMLGKAVGNLLQGAKKAPYVMTLVMLVIGSAMFYFSDLMLLFDRFADVSDIVDELCLGTYYPAQCLLAGSVFLYVNRMRKKHE